MEPEYKGTDSNCFACGTSNQRGLKLKFALIDDHVEARFVPDKDLEGWDDVVHGGIVSTLIDEAMSHAIFRLDGGSVVTAEMTVRFVKPMFVGKPFVVHGKIDGLKGRLIEASANITDQDGNLIAKGTGRFIRVGINQKLNFC